MSATNPDFLNARRTRIGQTLNFEGAILLVGAGQPVPLPEASDQTYPFRAHADYFYLANQECPGAIVAFDPDEATGNAWHSFVPAVSEAERVWEGREPWTGEPLAEFDGWLRARSGRRIVQLGAPLPGVSADRDLSQVVRAQFVHARRLKDAHEIALIRRAASATAAGFEKLRSLLQPGVTERALQIELEAEFFRHGATRTGYGSIVGTGTNSAVLHFEPSKRAARNGDFVLVDAGAELDRYMADVTRTFVVGEASPFQRDLYEVVLSTEKTAIAACQPGAEWRDLHLAAAVQMVAGLVELGVMRGNATSLVEQEAHMLFYPHGLGHMVGLGVRDGSGMAPRRTKDPRASLKNLRMDLPLAAGYVVTVEPGLYFIPPILNDPTRREKFRDAVNWSMVDAHLHLGGVRIEDNVLITTGDPDVLTSEIPKTLFEAR